MPDHDELHIRWELSLTDADDEAALAALLQDPAQRRAFARHARIAAALCKKPLPIATRPRNTRATPGLRPSRFTAHARPRWMLAASVLVLLGGVTMFALLAQRDTVAEPSLAHIEAADGTSIVDRDGRRRSAQAGAMLTAGESISTDTGKAIVILGQNSARLELASGSCLQLPDTVADQLPCELHLTVGQVLAEIAPRHAGASFTISSPVARSEVLGTRFTFDTRDDRAWLTVERGTVRLSTAHDAGLMVTAGQAAFVAEGMVRSGLLTEKPETPLPRGSQILARFAPLADPGWRGVVETAADGTLAWVAVAPNPGNPWCRAELRSPLNNAGWLISSPTWLRFRYQITTEEPNLQFEVHLKLRDESNYSQKILADFNTGWHEALLRVDGSFLHLTADHRPLTSGDRIHGVVWCALHEIPGPVVSFKIRDAVLFTVPEGVQP